MSKTILIRIESKYGRKLLYPANETANEFASMLGSKTLSRNGLERMESMGYKIQVQVDTDWRA